MPVSFATFNVVLVGENFPVQSVRISDFRFRGRELREQIRMGPMVQAAARGVEMTIIPDRFQAGIAQPDDLDVQSAGLRELVDEFLEYVGKRSIFNVGHNAQVRLEAGSYERAMGLLLNVTPAREIMGVASNPDSMVVYQSTLEPGCVLKMQVGETEERELLLDFNVDFDLRNFDWDLRRTLDLYRATLTRVEEIAERFGAKIAEEVDAS